MKTVLGVALALSVLLNVILLLRKAPEPPPPSVRTRVVEKVVTPEPSMPTPPAVAVAPPMVPTPVAPPEPAARPAVSLGASPGTAGSGSPITVTCTLTGGKPHPRHWIGLYAVGSEVTRYSGYLMVTGSPDYRFAAPRAPGTYEFRYVLEDNATVVATSNPVTVFVDPASRPVVDLQSGTSYVKPGGEIPAIWTLLSGKRTRQDWIGLFPAGAKNEDFVSWKYVADLDHGRLTLAAPEQPGTYEMRYLVDNGYEAVATSIRIVVLP